ncbi:MAG: SRPBCC family protein [Phaeodactylibacter sp.]|uniref:SRPBCC family protein n=1 Tax=Phaeodactylibacter sp. TaxID=1940289 RepID=UPI0032EFD0DB
MQILKIGLIVVLGLVGLAAVLGLIAPREVALSRSTVIKAPQEMVFGTVNDLNTWESWSPWKEMDPAMQVTMGKPSVGEGAHYSWTGEQSGEGRMEITSATAPEKLTTHVDFKGQGGADAAWTFEPVEGGTQTTWAFHTVFPYPFNAMLLFQDFEGAIAKDYDRGLELLKEQVEAKAMAAPQLKIQVVDLPMHYFLALRQTVDISSMDKVFATNTPKVHQAVTGAGLPRAGMPCGLYFTWDEATGTTDCAQAIPLAKAHTLNGFETIEIPEQKALLVDHYGSYGGLGAVHEAIDGYLKIEGLTAAMPVIEEYVTDTVAEPDTSKWLTRVYYPLAAMN